MNKRIILTAATMIAYQGISYCMNAKPTQVCYMKGTKKPDLLGQKLSRLRLLATKTRSQKNDLEALKYCGDIINTPEAFRIDMNTFLEACSIIHEIKGETDQKKKDLDQEKNAVDELKRTSAYMRREMR